MAQYPEFSFELGEPCTRRVVAAMLRNRRYRLEVTALKKDKGIHKIYMYDLWADPAMVKIGEYREGTEPDWGDVYDTAMAEHLARKGDGTRYGE